MQDPTAFQQIKPQFPEQEQLKCPRCDSTNTKFCYYNNYNLSQPRHFCKNCRRYWTKGGALRNIPVGGGSRKNTKRCGNPKRPASQPPDPEPTRARKLPDPPQSSTPAPAPAPAAESTPQQTGSDPDSARMYVLSADQDRKMLDIAGSFSSLLATNGQFGSLMEGLNPNGSGLKTGQTSGFVKNLNAGHGLDTGSGQDASGTEGSNNGESYLGVQNGDSGCWGGSSNGWPDLAIYTPGSNFQ